MALPGPELFFHLSLHLLGDGGLELGHLLGDGGLELGHQFLGDPRLGCCDLRGRGGGSVGSVGVGRISAAFSWASHLNFQVQGFVVDFRGHLGRMVVWSGKWGKWGKWGGVWGVWGV